MYGIVVKEDEVVQTEIERFLNSIKRNYSSLYILPKKSKKKKDAMAINKFEDFIFSEDSQYQAVSMAQAKLVFLGHKNIRGSIGLLKLCGKMSKIRQDNIGDWKERLAVERKVDVRSKLALQLLLRLLNPHHQTFRKKLQSFLLTFQSLTLKDFKLMKLETLANWEMWRDTVFYFIYLVLKYHANLENSLAIPEKDYQPIKITDLLKNQTLYDNYMEWQKEQSSKLEEESIFSEDESLESTEVEDMHIFSESYNVLSGVLYKDQSNEQSNLASTENFALLHQSMAENILFPVDPLGIFTGDVSKNQETFQVDSGFENGDSNKTSTVRSKNKSKKKGANVHNSQNKQVVDLNIVLSKIHFNTKTPNQEQLLTISKLSEEKLQLFCTITDDSFNSSLFLWKVHSKTTYNNLLNGLKTLMTDNEDQRTKLKALVHQNFNEFVQCRSTIGNIKTMLDEEDNLDKGYKSTITYPKILISNKLDTDHNRKHLYHFKSNSKKWTKNSHSNRVMICLEKSKEISDSFFQPLLHNRKRIYNLRCARNLLKRFEILYQLPNALRKLIQEKSFIESTMHFCEASIYLNILDVSFEEENSEISSKSIRQLYIEEIQDLEYCGEELITGLIGQITENFVSLEKSFSQSIASHTLDEKSIQYSCTVPLCLLLEIQNRLPAKSRLQSLFREDYNQQNRDLLATLILSQETYAIESMKKIDSTIKTTINYINVLQNLIGTLTPFINIWSELSSFLNLSTVSSNTIFENKNQNIPIRNVNIPKKHMSYYNFQTNYDQNSSNSVYRNLLTSTSDCTSLPHTIKPTSMDIHNFLFAIRKRIAISYPINKYTHVQKLLNNMAWKLISTFTEIVSKLVENSYQNYQESVVILMILHKTANFYSKLELIGMLSSMRISQHLQKQVALNTLKIKGLVDTEYSEAERKKKYIEKHDLYYFFEKNTESLISQKMQNFIKSLESRIVSDNFCNKLETDHISPKMLENKTFVFSKNEDPPHLIFIHQFSVDLKEVLKFIQNTVQPPLDKFLSTVNFFPKQFSFCIDNLEKCFFLLFRWMKSFVDSQTSSGIILLLFLDYIYINSVLVNEMEKLLKPILPPTFVDDKNVNVNKSLRDRLNAQMLIIEDNILTIYVKCNSKCFDSLIKAALDFNKNKNLWIQSPNDIRTYTLEILFCFTHVIVECSNKLSEKYLYRIISDLATDLMSIYLSYISSISDELHIHSDFCVQIHIEVVFLKELLSSYKSKTFTEYFNSILDILLAIMNTTEEDKSAINYDFIPPIVTNALKSWELFNSVFCPPKQID